MGSVVAVDAVSYTHLDKKLIWTQADKNKVEDKETETFSARSVKLHILLAVTAQRGRED